MRDSIARRLGGNNLQSIHLVEGNVKELQRRVDNLEETIYKLCFGLDTKCVECGCPVREHKYSKSGYYTEKLICPCPHSTFKGKEEG